MENNATGSKLLKVSGILMIIGGALAIVITLLGIGGIALLAAMAEEGQTEFNAGMAWAGIALSLLGGVIELIAGIIGTKNWNKPEKANTCIVWGGLVAAVSIIGSVMTTASGQNFPIVSLLTGLVLPALYIIGAIQNRKA